MPTVYDDDEFPLVRIHAIGDNTDRDIDQRIAYLERHLNAGPRFALVFDTSGAEPLSARHRRRWTTWLHENDMLVAERLAGCGVVITSAAVRAVFTTIFWASPPSTPYTFVGTRGEAESWARAMLATTTRIARGTGTP